MSEFNYSKKIGFKVWHKNKNNICFTMYRK